MTYTMHGGIPLTPEEIDIISQTSKQIDRALVSLRAYADAGIPLENNPALTGLAEQMKAYRSKVEKNRGLTKQEIENILSVKEWFPADLCSVNFGIIEAFATIIPTSERDCEEIERQRHEAMRPLQDVARRMYQLFAVLDKKMEPLRFIGTNEANALKR